MECVATYEYKNGSGKTVGTVRRFHKSEELNNKTSKEIIPYFRENNKGGFDVGIPEELKGNLPLYGLDTLIDKNKPVYVVEGEKCAFALHGLGLQSVTSQGGSKNAKGSKWDNLEGFNTVYILPDNDEAGYQYSKEVFQTIRGAVDNIKIITLPNLGKSEDVCDYIASIPESEDWNQLENINQVSDYETLKRVIIDGLADNTQEIPFTWKVVKGSKGLPAIAVADFQKLDIPPRDIYLSPWVTSQSISMVFAERGIGKTFFCLSCAVAIAKGEGVMGYESEGSVPVLYVDGEMQSPILQNRLEALCNGNKNIPLYLITPDFLEDRAMPDLSTKEGQDEISEFVDKFKVKALFIDNLSTLLRSGKENDSESWKQMQSWLIGLRSKGLAVILVHHANKAGGQRGTSSREDILDTVISLKRPDDYEESQGARFEVEYTKYRSLTGDEVKPFELNICIANGIAEWVRSNSNSKREKAIEMNNLGMRASEIADSLKVDVSTVYKYIKGNKRKEKPKIPLIENNK